MRNENKVDEMVSILDELHQYVPSTQETMEVFVPTESDSDVIEVDNFHQILLGGDQLTAVRALSAQAVRQNSESGHTKLQGFEPTVEDWHAKMCFMEVGSYYYEMCGYIISYSYIHIRHFRLYGGVCSKLNLVVSMAQCGNYSY